MCFFVAGVDLRLSGQTTHTHSHRRNRMLRQHRNRNEIEPQAKGDAPFNSLSCRVATPGALWLRGAMVWGRFINVAAESSQAYTHNHSRIYASSHTLIHHLENGKSRAQGVFSHRPVGVSSSNLLSNSPSARLWAVASFLPLLLHPLYHPERRTNINLC